MDSLILIVDDEKLIRWSIEERLKEKGLSTLSVANGTQAIKSMEKGGIDLVLLDYKLPDINGLEILTVISKKWPDVPVILMTAYSTVDRAVKAMKLGAFDYINKPFNMEEFLLIINKALETTNLKRQIKYLRSELEDKFGIEGIIGKSPEMEKIFKLIKKVSSSQATTVLLQGESGTGKDLVAKTIHYQSDRCGKPFMNITATALPENLLESELFGHEKGSFTDAKVRKHGLLEIAEGGTVFLDEIGDMPSSLQAKLLRFLEEKTFRRVGGTRDIRVDVRIIAATNKPLKKLVNNGEFRADLYYRLMVIPINLPPLRERGNDIKLLTTFYIDYFNKELKKNVLGFSDDAMELMLSYHWPGNVRELRNMIERAMLLSQSDWLEREDLFFEPDTDKPEKERTSGFFSSQPIPAEKKSLEEIEQKMILKALEKTGWNQSRAAKLLEMTRDQIRYRIKKFDLKEK